MWPIDLQILRWSNCVNFGGDWFSVWLWRVKKGLKKEHFGSFF